MNPLVDTLNDGENKTKGRSSQEHLAKTKDVKSQLKNLFSQDIQKENVSELPRSYFK